MRDDDGYRCPEVLAESSEKRRELSGDELDREREAFAAFGRLVGCEKVMLRLNTGALAIEWRPRFGGGS